MYRSGNFEYLFFRFNWLREMHSQQGQLEHPSIHQFLSLAGGQLLFYESVYDYKTCDQSTCLLTGPTLHFFTSGTMYISHLSGWMLESYNMKYAHTQLALDIFTWNNKTPLTGLININNNCRCFFRHHSYKVKPN
jgi:hypothetical protein